MEKNLQSILTSVAVSSTLVTTADAENDSHRPSYAVAKAHLALPITNIERTKEFYVSVFQVPAREGKTPEGKVIYAFEVGPLAIAFNELPNLTRDGIMSLPAEMNKQFDKSIRETYFVPSLHFGFFHLTLAEFNEIIKRLKQKNARFLMQPTVLKPKTGHGQLLAFATDPDGYVIEIRASASKRGSKPKEFEQQDKANVKVTK